jgi:hypothetical protein
MKMSIDHNKPILKHRGRNRAVRPKTFKTEASAEAWAKKNKVANYKLINLKYDTSADKKIRIEYFE